MSVTKEEILDFVQDAPETQLRKFALVITSMLEPKHLKVLQSRFKKRVVFENPSESTSLKDIPELEPTKPRGRPKAKSDPEEEEDLPGFDPDEPDFDLDLDND